MCMWRKKYVKGNNTTGCPMAVTCILLVLTLPTMAAATTTTTTTTTTTCTNGTASYGDYALSLAGYWGDTLARGGQIGYRSAGCSLPVTPTEFTFNVWGYIYSHLTLLSVPGQLESEEMFHLKETFDETRTWLGSFLTDVDNGKAVAALRDIECHARMAAHHACETSPRSNFACCSLAQAATWYRVAVALSDAIYVAYGKTCGSRLLDDETIELHFAEMVRAIVRDVSPSGVNGVARSAALSVVAWALRGICGDGKRDECTPAMYLNASERATLFALRDQTDVAWSAALVCRPDGQSLV